MAKLVTTLLRILSDHLDVYFFYPPSQLIKCIFFFRKPQSKRQRLTTGTFFSLWPEIFHSAVLGGHSEKDKKSDILRTQSKDQRVPYCHKGSASNVAMALILCMNQGQCYQAELLTGLVTMFSMTDLCRQLQLNLCTYMHACSYSLPLTQRAGLRDLTFKN